MKNWIIIALLFFLVACKEEEKTDKKEIKAAEKIEQETDLEIKYATCFEIRKEAGKATELIIKNPFDSYKTQQYFILSRTANEHHQAKDNKQKLTVPVKGIIPFSSSFITMIDTLSGMEKVLGVETGNYIYNQKIQEGIKTGKIAELGTLSNLNIEKTIMLLPDIVVTSGFSREQPVALQKLQEAGIISIINYDWKETHPLGKAEWIKFWGVLLGKEKEANTIFNGIEKQYLALKKEVENRASVNVLFNNLYNGTWYIPGGKSYVAQLLTDAGGVYPWASEMVTGSIPLSLESISVEAHTFDIWINPGYDTKEALLKADSRYKIFLDAVGEQIYNQNKRKNKTGGNDYFERGALRADLLLKDYIELFKLEECKEENLYFFKKVK